MKINGLRIAKSFRKDIFINLFLFSIFLILEDLFSIMVKLNTIEYWGLRILMLSVLLLLIIAKYIETVEDKKSKNDLIIRARIVKGRIPFTYTNLRSSPIGFITDVTFKGITLKDFIFPNITLINDKIVMGQSDRYNFVRFYNKELPKGHDFNWCCCTCSNRLTIKEFCKPDSILGYVCKVEDDIDHNRMSTNCHEHGMCECYVKIKA
jgi:Ca2+/Na+ antiporter